MRKFAVLEMGVFNYFVLQTMAKILDSNFKNRFLKSLSFFLDLVPDIVYRRIAAAFFGFLVSFKLNLKLGLMTQNQSKEV